MAKERNTAQIIARVAVADREWLDREAERQGMPISCLVRTTIRRQRLASEAAAGFDPASTPSHNSGRAA